MDRNNIYGGLISTTFLEHSGTISMAGPKRINIYSTKWISIYVTQRNNIYGVTIVDQYLWYIVDLDLKHLEQYLEAN